MLPSCDPLPPYRHKLTQIYRLLLERGEAVVSCEPVIYEGNHVMGMYDIIITNLNDDSPGIYLDCSTAPVSIRLYPESAKYWNEYK
jgi:hypothetical protein